MSVVCDHARLEAARPAAADRHRRIRDIVLAASVTIILLVPGLMAWVVLLREGL